MITYTIANPGDEEKLLDFANYVFSQSHRPHDFRTLLPKVYGEGIKNAGMHYVAKESNGDIRAMLCVLPLDFIIAGNHLRCGVVGSVSVHPYYRGEGYMKQLMRLMIDDCKEKRIDVLALSGQRQRYNYFGFEYAGYCAEYLINRDNIRHTQKDVMLSGYSMVNIESDDEPLCKECYKLYETGLIHGARPEGSYLRYAKSWQSVLHAIIKDGRFIGSLIDNEWDGRAIKEILLNDESEIGPVLKLWFEKNPEAQSTTIRVWPFERDRMKEMNDICEKMNIIPGQMIRILNGESTIRAALDLKSKCGNLNDGSTVIQLAEKKIALSVKDGVAKVESSDENAEMSLSDIDVVRKLFAQNVLMNPNGDILFNWLPLPWAMPSPDRF